MTAHSYPDSAGLDNRANSALIEIEAIMDDRSIPSAVRLVLIAQRMEQEPVLTDQSTGAFRARRNAVAVTRARSARINREYAQRTEGAQS